jgi:hypothetical protein
MNRFVLIVAAFSGLVASASAQSGVLVPAEDRAYRTIQLLQRRGLLLELNPSVQPYRRGEIADALSLLDDDALDEAERRWVELLRSEFGGLRPGPLTVGGDVEGAVRVTNSKRLEPIRQLDDKVRAFPYIRGSAFLAAGPAAANLSIRYDEFYERDPDGFDAVRRLRIRSQDAYLGVSTRFFSAYAGRFSNHWAPSGETAPLLSLNPRSYDQLNLRLGTETLSIRSVFGELDNATPDGNFTGSSAAPGSIRRFVSAHRFDWRPSKNLVISLQEALIYAGANAAPALRYINPVHAFAFVVANIPQNERTNGFMSGLIWLRHRQLSGHLQLLLDDFDILNGEEPASVAASASLKIADILASVDLGMAFDVVSARSYSSNESDTKYLYLNRGLATQFSDYLGASIEADVFLDSRLQGLTLTPSIELLWQGQHDIRDPFPENDGDVGFVLTGVVERTARTGVVLDFQRSRNWWVRADVGVNRVWNADHVDGQSRTRFVGFLEAGVRIYLSGAVPVNF